MNLKHKILRRVLIAVILTSGTSLVSAQNYYRDIYQINKKNIENKNLKQKQIRSIRILSLDAQNSPDNSFRFSQTFSEDFRESRTETASSASLKDYISTTYDSLGRVVQTIDSTEASINITKIYYGKKGRIDSLVFSSSSTSNRPSIDVVNPEQNYGLDERHLYFYSADGNIPQKMERRRQSRLLSTIYFDIDSTGRVFKEYQKIESSPIYYYKYNDRGLLTDLFHFNTNTKKMVPDILFDYDDQNRLVEKTVAPVNGSSYLIWKYQYNDEGFKKTEKAYDRKETLQGSMVYRYEKGAQDH